MDKLDKSYCQDCERGFRAFNVGQPCPVCWLILTDLPVKNEVEAQDYPDFHDSDIITKRK